MYRPKMSTIFKVLFAPLLWLFNSCSQLGEPVDKAISDNHYYDRSKSDIRYSPMGNSFELGNTPMNAHVASFEVLSPVISRDINRIYFEANPVENLEVDLNSFHVKNVGYMSAIALDKDYVYGFEKFLENQKEKARAIIIKDADPKTYLQTNWDWAEDGTHHFFKHHIINADYDSFEVLSDYFAKDSARMFIRRNNRFEAFKADIPSFKILKGNGHGIDHTNVYWLPFFTENAHYPITLPYENEDQVEYLNRYFLRIADTIYYDGIPMPEIDAPSFVAVGHEYGKDVNHAYYENQIIPDADVASFEDDKESGIMDKNGRYRNGKLIPKEQSN